MNGPKHDPEKMLASYALIEVYEQDLFRWARWLTGDFHEAQDLLAETHIRALQKIDQLKSPSLLKPWLFRIMKNMFLSGVKRRDFKQVSLDEAMDVPNDCDDPTLILEESIDPVDVFASILHRTTLPNREYLLTWLINKGNHSLIADRLHISDHAERGKKCSFLRWIRRLLDHDPNALRDNTPPVAWMRPAMEAGASSFREFDDSTRLWFDSLANTDCHSDSLILPPQLEIEPFIYNNTRINSTVRLISQGTQSSETSALVYLDIIVRPTTLVHLNLDTIVQPRVRPPFNTERSLYLGGHCLPLRYWSGHTLDAMSYENTGDMVACGFSLAKAWSCLQLLRIKNNLDQVVKDTLSRKTMRLVVETAMTNTMSLLKLDDFAPLFIPCTPFDESSISFLYPYPPA